jgi:anaerobic selenocysteine-containing dehydrogenase
MASRLDRLTKSTAVALSRRGFLKRVPLVGVGVGLGLAASAAPAYACTDSWTETRTTHGSCGGCGPHNRWNFHQRRNCMQCTGGLICSTWATYKEDCSVC